MASKIYFLKGFNNYSNRIVKKFSTVQGYLDYLDTERPSETNYCLRGTSAVEMGGYGPVNFNINDGLSAEITYNYDNNQDWDPDYVLVCEDVSNPAEYAPKYCFFVMESVRTRKGQYRLFLRRDVVADYEPEILEAQTFIERATLNPGSMLIFNDEGLKVNQIKTSETLLKDPSNCAWVVGYLSPNTTATTITSNEAVEIDGSFADAEAFGTYLSTLGIKDYCATSESDLSGSGVGNSPTSTDSKVFEFQITYICRAPAYLDSTATQSIGYNALRFYFDTNSSSVSAESVNGPGSSVANVNTNTGLQYYAYDVSVNLFKGWTSVRNNFRDNISNRTSTLQSSILSYTGHTDTYQRIGNFTSKKYKVGNDYYQLSLNTSSTSWELVGRFGTNNSHGFITSLNSMSEVSAVNSVSSDAIAIQEHMRNAYISISKISSAELTFELTGGERICGTLPYKMFAIPYSRTKNISISYNGTTISMAKELALSIGKAISAKYSGANALYDLQLLPYCPAQNIITGDHAISVPTNNTITTLVKKNNTNIGVIYWCADNKGTFNINHTITTVEPKIETICDMYRLSSPNWNGQFEFNAAKNGGVDQFNVDFTYKPHCPYIHINPNFGKLYGSDFDDARGLICQGDFSLPQTSEAWNTYEIQNKNYQNQFERQIKNMEVMHDYDMKELGVKGIAGIVQGGASGVAAGSLGGIGGMIAGGILGAATSAIGSAADQQLSNLRFKETKSYTEDIHEMQLQNIKAMPSNLTNVGAMTYNNKLFPLLEYYSCSSEERTAVTNYIYWYGMTVKRVGQISEFLQDDYSFISGSIIRINIIGETHIVEAIRDEIDKGVFIK